MQYYDTLDPRSPWPDRNIKYDFPKYGDPRL